MKKAIFYTDIYGDTQLCKEHLEIKQSLFEEFYTPDIQLRWGDILQMLVKLEGQATVDFIPYKKIVIKWL